MGRTNPTFRDRLSRLRGEFDDYRRALRRRDQPHFDRLFEHASAHADACGYLDHDSPLVPVLFSVALEQEVRLAAHEDRLADLAARLDELEAQYDDLDDHVATLTDAIDGVDRRGDRDVDDCQAVIERYWQRE